MKKMKLENKRESNRNNRLKKSDTEGNIDLFVNPFEIDRIILEALIRI